MPTPGINLGLQGAYGVAGAQDALQQLLVERELKRQQAIKEAEAAARLGLDTRKVNVSERATDADIRQGDERIGLDRQRVGFEGERVGLEGRRVDQDVREWDEQQPQRAANVRLSGAQAGNLERQPAKEQTDREHDLLMQGRNIAGQKDVARIHAETSGRRVLTPNAALQTTRSLRNDFVRETAAAKTVATQLALMQSSLEAVNTGKAAAGSQGVLVTFQKILDPTSVVRESEYARSAAGQSILSRLEGQWMKIREGGAGVPPQELAKFVALAEQFARNQAQSANETKRQIDAIATEYGLKPELITREFGEGGESGATGSGVGIKSIREIK